MVHFFLTQSPVRSSAPRRFLGWTLVDRLTRGSIRVENLTLVDRHPLNTYVLNIVPLTDKMQFRHNGTTDYIHISAK